MKNNASPDCPFDETELEIVRGFVAQLRQGTRRHLLRNDIVLQFSEFEREKKGGHGLKSLLEKIQRVQELLLFDDRVVIQYREGPARYQIFSLTDNAAAPESVSADSFLEYRERIAGFSPVASENRLEIDFEPFYLGKPRVAAGQAIGNGRTVLNEHLAEQMRGDIATWQVRLLEFLTSRFLEGQPILLDGNVIPNVPQLQESVKSAVDFLESVPVETSLPSLLPSLSQWGILPGFGDNSERIKENLESLLTLLNEPDEQALEDFFQVLPLVSRVAVISPHGWFGQDKVLGRPDTGGQIVYILDQVKALEKYLESRLVSAGVDAVPKIIVLTRLIPDNEGTNCNVRMEQIHSTHNSWILRVPFYDSDHQPLPQWMSRFKIWPYLEQFSHDGQKELVAEFGGQPDVVIGNYSDGNLVASLLASRMEVVQCNIAHALEKSKYLFSALFWKDMEADYKFSLQFAADLLAMNQTDIVISSTAQEIAGTNTVMGQYESYFLYSLPELYQVKYGISLDDSKFNVISPGVDETIYFPNQEQGRRSQENTEQLERRLFEDEGEDIFGFLEEPELPPVFTMARLDKIKNLTGLVDAFGQDAALREKANLIVVTRTLRNERVTDEEERQELEKMYELINRHELHGKIRWVENASRENGAEFYRIIADRRGVFVQPALFEAFGLTVLESMVSGLPIFATQFGGPMETIEDGVNGFWVNPTQLKLLSGPILKFLERCDREPETWDQFSQAGIDRVKRAYTWSLYSEKLMKCVSLFSFWNFSGNREDKKQMNQFCNLMFHKIFKDRL